MATRRETDKTKPGRPSKQLRQDKLVERLVADPSNPTQAQVLLGYLGHSDRPGFWRVYSTPELGNDYIEFRERDFLYSEPLETGESSLGGSVVWLDAAAEVTRTQGSSRETQARFLEGDIADRYMTEAEFDDLLGTSNAAFWGTIIRLTIRLTRRLSSKVSICRPCSKRSICNFCLPPGQPPPA